MCVSIVAFAAFGGAHTDHVLRVVVGGYRLGWENIVAACQACQPSERRPDASRSAACTLCDRRQGVARATLALCLVDLQLAVEKICLAGRDLRGFQKPRGVLLVYAHISETSYWMFTTMLGAYLVSSAYGLLSPRVSPPWRVQPRSVRTGGRRQHLTLSDETHTLAAKGTQFIVPASDYVTERNDVPRC